MTGDFESDATVFALLPCDDAFSVVPRDLLQAVADSEDRDVQVEHFRVDVRRIGGVDGVGTSGEDDARGFPRQVGEFLGAGQHFRVDVQFAESAGDEMRVLRAEIEDEDRVEGLMGRRGCGRAILVGSGRHVGWLL